jgi:hypothetical protein
MHPRAILHPLLLALLCGLGAPVLAADFDPVTMDPPAAGPPPRMDGVSIPSGSTTMNGIVYVPGGPGPHPVALVLHGLPGNERNLDLAQALRRAGWAVVFFHYRGAWGSGGAFGFRNVLEDVGAAVDWSLQSGVRERFGLGEGPRTLVGHSMGGFAALGAGAEDEDVGCIASLAGANLGLLGRAVADPELERRVVESMDAYARGPLSGTSGTLLVSELAREAERFDLMTRIEALADHPLLLVAGSRDEVLDPAAHHAPLLAGLRDADADVRAHVLDDDHAFSASRIALSRALVEWMGAQCR